MVWWQAALWGLTGGLLSELLELYEQIHQTPDRWDWRRPIPQGMPAFVVSTLIRLGAGCAVAAALAHDGQVAGATAAFGAGVAAPLVIEKLARLAPLSVDTQAVLEPSAASSGTSSVATAPSQSTPASPAERSHESSIVAGGVDNAP